MGRVPEGAQASALTAAPGFDGRVTYFPVRHHSPACAWHVERLIREKKPQAVLIEGPSDATPLLPHLRDPRTRTPVALYTTWVQPRPGDPPLRHAAYYPFCDASPELAAIRAAEVVGAKTRFIDLSFPEMVVAGNRRPDPRAHSLQDESRFSHSRFLLAACRSEGARDPDDLWDRLFELDFDRISTWEFVRRVLAWCELARRDSTKEELQADGCLAREAAMAAAIAKERGSVVVVTGGFHTIALPQTEPQPPPAVTGSDPGQVVLMRYSFEQLDRLNGYASGMPSPEFYQRVRDGRDPLEFLVDLARQLRHRQGGSTADAVAATAQARGLAAMRRHARISREDLIDGVRSTFVKGVSDVEGVMVLAMARKLLAGDRVGEVPPDAGQPPIVGDFRASAARLRIDLDRVEAREVPLDIYKSQAHREISRFFHRLAFLAVPFARWLRGPDFVRGEGLERVQEAWSYRWTPSAESALIEKSMYGASLEEAATSLLLERLDAASSAAAPCRAKEAAALLLEACRMGLHRRTQDLLQRMRELVAVDGSFASVAGALEQLLVLQISREPLEAHHLGGVPESAAAAYERACYLLPMLATTPPEQEDEELDALKSLLLSAGTLGDTEDRRDLRHQGLRDLAGAPGGSAALRGAAFGALHGDGAATDDDIARELQGHLLATGGTEGAAFLRGLLGTGRDVLWRVPAVITAIHDRLLEWEEEQFVALLPLLRLAFSGLTPRECDRLGRAVASHAGVGGSVAVVARDVSGEAALFGAALNQRIRKLLEEDGLESFGA